MKNKTIIGVLAVLLLFVAPYFALIAYFSYFNKDVVYLRGGGPPWMLNPDDAPLTNGFPDDIPATYTLSFALASPPAEAHIAINAVKSHVLKVNDAVLSDEQGTYKKGWKSSSEYDIAKYLRPGVNTISLRVKSWYSVTALKTRGEVVGMDGGRVPLDSGEQWLVSSEKAFPQQNIVPGVFKPVEVLQHFSMMDKIRAGEYWPGSLVLFAAAVLLTAALFILPGAFRGIDVVVQRAIPESLKTKKAREALSTTFVLAVFAVLAVTLYDNFLKYPAERTGDFQYHLEYFNHFLSSWRVPLAEEGFQMYNPPLFYLSSAVLYKVFGPGQVMTGVVKYAQLLNSVSTFITVYLVYLIVRRLTGDTATSLIALALTAFLPVCLYKAPSVSGESLFTLLCTAIFYVWLRYLDSPGRGLALAAGLLFGLAFMTRITTLFPLMGVLAGFLYTSVRDAGKRRAVMLDLAVFLAALAAVSGWYYVRNLVHYHQLFPISGTPGLFFFRQVPGFRDWDFYTNVSAVLVNNPLNKSNVMESLFAGCYSTFWYDGQRLFVVTINYMLVFTALALAVLPTSMMVSGAVKSAAQAVTGWSDGRAVFLGSCLITLSLSVAAFVLGSLRWPTYAWQKAHYIMYCLVPFICFLALGFKGLAARAGWFYISIWVAALCLINLAIFYL